MSIANDQYSLSYRNQSVDLQCKSMDWFRYDVEHWSLLGQPCSQCGLKLFRINIRVGLGVDSPLILPQPVRNHAPSRRYQLVGEPSVFSPDVR